MSAPHPSAASSVRHDGNDGEKVIGLEDGNSAMLHRKIGSSSAKKTRRVERSCSIKCCGRASVGPESNGMCGEHYANSQAADRKRPKDGKKLCSVAGCPRLSNGNRHRGMCMSHCIDLKKLLAALSVPLREVEDVDARKETTVSGTRWLHKNMKLDKASVVEASLAKAKEDFLEAQELAQELTLTVNILQGRIDELAKLAMTEGVDGHKVNAIRYRPLADGH